METNKSINRSDIQKNLYNALVEAYNLDKDIITSYGDVVTLKRGRDDQDKDEDPSVGLDRGTKRIKSSKDAEPLKGSKSKESKSSSSSKGSQSRPKSSSKSTQAEEPKLEVTDTEMQQDQWNESGHVDDQPDNEGKYQSVKVKELQDKRILEAFKLSYQEKYEHVGPKSQDHVARLQDDVKRLCLVGDLKKLKITFKSSSNFQAKHQSVKVKELQDKRILKAFKLTYQEKYEHVCPKSQDHKLERWQDDVMRLYLPKSLGKSTQAEEPELEAADTEMQQDQGNESGHVDDQPDNEAAPKHDWFLTSDKPPTPDRAWNKSKSIV
ncbi:hypothetical protein Tco_0917710 [Tanacetum coccineum]